MNWTLNITYSVEGEPSLKTICETHELKGMNFWAIQDWIEAHYGNTKIESVSIWLDDVEMSE